VISKPLSVIQMRQESLTHGKPCGLLCPAKAKLLRGGRY